MREEAIIGYDDGVVEVGGEEVADVGVREGKRRDGAVAVVEAAAVDEDEDRTCWSREV